MVHADGNTKPIDLTGEQVLPTIVKQMYFFTFTTSLSTSKCHVIPLFTPSKAGSTYSPIKSIQAVIAMFWPELYTSTLSMKQWGVRFLPNSMHTPHDQHANAFKAWLYHFCLSLHHQDPVSVQSNYQRCHLFHCKKKWKSHEFLKKAPKWIENKWKYIHFSIFRS